MTSSHAPVIRTERLILRPHTTADFEACYAMWSDSGVTKHIGGVPSTKAQTWARILTYAGLWSHLGFGYWLIEEAQTNAFVGETGFADFRRDIDPSMRNVPEIGFALGPAFHGKGYATEAVRAILEWGDRNLPSRRTVALVNEHNVPSLRVCEKAGYREFNRADFNGQPAVFLERVAP